VIPDPETVERQKAGYAKALEKQFADGVAQISAETKAKKEAMIAAAEQNKAQYKLQKEAEMQGQHLLLEQQKNSQMMMLQETVMAQKSALEQQACALALEYQQKKAQEEMMAKQYEIQKQYYEAEAKLATQYAAVTQPRQAVVA
jgi:hypothetical protein